MFENTASFYLCFLPKVGVMGGGGGYWIAYTSNPLSPTLPPRPKLMFSILWNLVIFCKTSRYPRTENTASLFSKLFYRFPNLPVCKTSRCPRTENMATLFSNLLQIFCQYWPWSAKWLLWGSNIELNNIEATLFHITANNSYCIVCVFYRRICIILYSVYIVSILKQTLL